MRLTTNIEDIDILQKFIDWLCSELRINPRSLDVYAEDDLVCAFGMCVDTSSDEFMILVKTKGRTITQYFNTIAHEMIHVKQFMKENLGHFLDSCSDVPYMEHWWEIEAHKESFPLVVKFTEAIQNGL